MGSLLFYMVHLFSLLMVLVYSVPLTEFVYPEYNASNLKYVDSGGNFLFSRNGAFKASILNPGGAQQQRFYLCVIHVKSSTIIWSANRNSPVSKLGIMSLTANGMSVSEEDGTVKWSTPPVLTSSVSALQLTDVGNLLLIDSSNETLWESFQNPTDTIVIGQQLRIETVLFSAVSGDDLSQGEYGLVLTESDAILQWRSTHTYWKLSMDTKTFKNSNSAVEYMAINQTGLYLFGRNGTEVVSKVVLPPSEFRTAKIDDFGRFIISSQHPEFVGPVDECRIANVCGKIGLCSHSQSNSANGHACSCPLSFWATTTSHDKTNCLPMNSSFSLPVSCNATYNSSHLHSSNLSYLLLGNNVDYFANDFERPIKTGLSLSLCQDLCSNDCTCLGMFYEKSSGSCFIVKTELGSVMSMPSSKSRQGFIKSIVRASINVDNAEATRYSTVVVVLFVSSCFFYLFVIGILLWRRFSISNRGKLRCSNATPSRENENLIIPGLPVRFSYQQLKSATEGFMTPIGTGGFGTVYKGVFPNKTFVAVKKINVLSGGGKKDFLNEIAIIGNIHHVNLVKLKGYCCSTERGERMLVYEYMSRGSLEKTLFGNSPVLEWQQRVEIAVGAARGLAYLHSGNEKKIIHCDVKPENILLDHNFKAKISDFGLSKVLSPDQSSTLLSTMRGTRGYLAPEWLTSSTISDKTDIYSFGMVLLELISGRKNCPRNQCHDANYIDSGGNASVVPENVYFPLYALELHEEKRYSELVDPRLEGRVASEDVERLVCVALCCVHEEPGLRPSMISVLRMLEGEIAVGEPRIESLKFLHFYGRRFSENSSTPEESHVPHVDSSYIASQQISDPR